MSIALLSALLFFLLGAAACGCLSAALQQIGRLRAKEEFKKIRSLFFFQHFLKLLFGKKGWEGLFLSLSFGKHLLHLCFGILALFLLLTQPFLKGEPPAFDTLWVLTYGSAIVLLSLITDLIFKLFAFASPLAALKTLSPIASFFLVLLAPLTFCLSKIFLSKKSHLLPAENSIRDKILEMLDESEVSALLDPQERKLILSVANFKQRSVREVMVPRIDVVALEEEASLSDAIELFLQQRYSRLPVYHDNIDHIVGVLLYKDILAAHIQGGATSLKSLIKPVLYTPETKKISVLLQEFRSKQVHLAIVVDEYGGTEGMITIEDILEELVGEIADEDDTDQEVLFSSLPTGGWIVDARMTISDIEKELFVRIPPSAEYDTLGGYIYHRAGAIPSQGWRLHHDDFDLEILSSDERSIEKVKIIPHELER